MKYILAALLLVAPPAHAADSDRARAHEAWIAKCLAITPRWEAEGASRIYFKCLSEEPRPIHHDWEPLVVLAFGQGLDTLTTLRPTPTCIERNPLLGPHPSAMAVLVPKLAIIGGVSLLVRFTEARDSRAARIIAKSAAYLGAAVGVKDGIGNLRLCGWQ